MGKRLELAIGALNGAVGDYLVRTGNGLATEMALFRGGERVELTRAAMAAAYPDASPTVAVLVHGLMCTEHVWSFEDGSDYGSLLQTDLAITPLYVRYNTGLPIPDNGAALASLLETVALLYPVPVERIILIGYSMGGLVVRGACHTAAVHEHAWLAKVDRAIYVGTPHLGAPLERYARVVTDFLRRVDDPYAQMVASLAELRSDGVKDLGDGDIRHEDRTRRQPVHSLRDPRHPVPLLPHIQHFLIAGTLWRDASFADLFGDAIVPLPSATDGHVSAKTVMLAPGHMKILHDVHHVGLAHHPEVYRTIRNWCGGESHENPEA